MSLVASLVKLISTYQNTVLVVFLVFLTEKKISVFTSFVIANLGQKGLCFLILSGGVLKEETQSFQYRGADSLPSFVTSNHIRSCLSPLS